MTYKLGVDVGGTFTDVLLIDSQSGSVHTAKVPSTPEDSSIGVLNGIARACNNAGVDLGLITQVTHGTTVATNAVLTGSGATVGLVTTRGYRQVLQIARSYVLGGGRARGRRFQRRTFAIGNRSYVIDGVCVSIPERSTVPGRALVCWASRIIWTPLTNT